MTRKSGKKPVDTATFVQQDQKLQQDGGNRGLSSVKDCSNQWTLKVNVRGEVGIRKPTLTGASVEIEWSDRTLDAPVCTATLQDRARATPLVDHGARTGTCRAKAAGWYLDAEKPVSLADGDDKTVELLLKPAVWVAFELVDHASGELIDGIHLKANAPILGDRTATSLKDDVLEFEHDDLRPGARCTLLDLEHDTLVYEVVGTLTTA